MNQQQRIQTILNALADFQACSQCGTRFRFGDQECPHCGEDLDDYLTEWAKSLLEELKID